MTIATRLMMTLRLLTGVALLFAGMAGCSPGFNAIGTGIGYGLEPGYQLYLAPPVSQTCVHYGFQYWDHFSCS